MNNQCLLVCHHASGLITNSADSRAQKDTSPSVRCPKKPVGSPGAATACTAPPAQAASAPGSSENMHLPGLLGSADSSRARGRSSGGAHADKLSQHSRDLHAAGSWQEGQHDEGIGGTLPGEAHAALQQQVEGAAGKARWEPKLAAAGEELCTQMLMETPMELWDFDSQRPRAAEEEAGAEPLLTQGMHTRTMPGDGHVLVMQLAQ